MANVSAPRGFRPYGDLKSIGIYIAAATIMPGDAVALDAGASSTVERKARVKLGVAGAALVGVAMNYATVGQSVRVADSPSQLFAGQVNGATADNQDDLGLNCSILATAGNTQYKISRQELNSATLAVTATLECKLLGYVDRQDGKNELGASVEAIFKINNHQLSAGTGTLAV